MPSVLCGYISLNLIGKCECLSNKERSQVTALNVPSGGNPAYDCGETHSVVRNLSVKALQFYQLLYLLPVLSILLLILPLKIHEGPSTSGPAVIGIFIWKLVVQNL